jgi:hypothetical protein
MPGVTEPRDLDAVEALVRRYFRPGSTEATRPPGPDPADVFESIRTAARLLENRYRPPDPALTAVTSDAGLAAALRNLWPGQVDVIVVPVDWIPPDKIVMIDQARIEADLERAVEEELRGLADRLRREWWKL